MDYQDQMLPCDACGGTFPFAAKEREFYEEKGFSPPRRCAGARKARKSTGQAERYADGCPFGLGAGGGPSAGGHRPRPAAPRPAAPRAPMPGTGEYLSGHISKVVAERGFGFLRGDDEQDYFFDAVAVQSSLGRVTPGMRVTFEVVRAPRGLRAQNVAAE